MNLKLTKRILLGTALAGGLLTAVTYFKSSQPEVTSLVVQPAFVESPFLKPKYYQLNCDIKPLKGMEGNIAFWDAVYSSSPSRAIVAGNHSRKNMKLLDYSSLWDDHKSIETNIANIDFKVRKEVNVHNKTLGCKWDPIFKEWIKCKDPLVFKTSMNPQLLPATISYTAWRQHLEEIFARQGLPPYLARLSVVESLMNPYADSSVLKKNKKDKTSTWTNGAVGYYQFVSEIATRFGLYLSSEEERPKEIDERRNILLSGLAAADYLAHEIQLFKRRYPDADDLAYLMSTSLFQAGASKFNAAMKASKKLLEKQGKKDASLEEIFTHALSMSHAVKGFRSNSKDYPPQLYAAVHLGNSLTHSQILPTKDVELITLENPSSVKLKDLVQYLNIDRITFFDLNPQYLASKFDELSLGNGYNHVRFLVPQGIGDHLEEALKQRITYDSLRIAKFYASLTPSATLEAVIKNDSYSRCTGL